MKLLLNLCLIANSAVPRGGVIAVDISGEDNALTMRVEAKGTNAKLSHSAADFLTNPVPNEPVDGHSIQFYFTTLLAARVPSDVERFDCARHGHAGGCARAADPRRPACRIFR